ncbi:CpsD/CapB family tyrosine-protein kinase [Bacterioplanoides sp.]|uniref:CpsD/CapB family tyrosine-protein kinase n=1 Tax=Bacterioplanoides sp. TaxID=2066072 RepID=UPI003B5B8D9A
MNTMKRMNSNAKISERFELPIHYAELESIYSQTIDRGLRSLAVTSCNGGEGTTTLACALARRAEAGGHKTLLVDMNFCRPAIAAEMGLENSSWQNLDQHLTSQIETTHVAAESAGCLAVLPAPVTPTGNLMLREKHYLSRCLEAWLQEYEVVIIDTSPLNAINRHNLPAERIAAECEGVLLMVKAGVTRQSHLNSAVNRLNTLGIQLSGCVYNDAQNPSLADELIRETYRLQRWLPGPMGWIRKKVRSSPLLNMSI